VSLEVLKGFLLFFIKAFLFFIPFSHLCIAVTSCCLFGKERLPGFIHGQDVIEDNDFIELIGGETELIFDFDESLGFELFIKLVRLFDGHLFREFEAFEEIVDNFLKFNTIDGRLLLEDSGDMMGV
jgi:hypothetical protein